MPQFSPAEQYRRIRTATIVRHDLIVGMRNMLREEKGLPPLNVRSGEEQMLSDEMDYAKIEDAEYAKCV